MSIVPSLSVIDGETFVILSTVSGSSLSYDREIMLLESTDIPGAYALLDSLNRLLKQYSGFPTTELDCG